MGYSWAIPAAISVMIIGILIGLFFARRQREAKRLDFRKGTTYEEPQDEGTPEGSVRRADERSE